MTTLDDPLNLPNPSEVSPRPIAWRYGLIGALIIIAIDLVFHLSGWISYTERGSTGNIVNQLIQIAVISGVVVMVIKTHRDEDLGGFIKYGRTLGVGTLAGLFMGLLTAIWTFVFFTFIDPEATEMIREMAWETALERGTSEADLQKAKGIMDFFTSPLWMAIFVTLMITFISFIASLIAGAIMKKEPATGF